MGTQATSVSWQLQQLLLNIMQISFELVVGLFFCFFGQALRKFSWVHIIVIWGIKKLAHTVPTGVAPIHILTNSERFLMIAILMGGCCIVGLYLAFCRWFRFQVIFQISWFLYRGQFVWRPFEIYIQVIFYRLLTNCFSWIVWAIDICWVLLFIDHVLNIFTS